jgi:AcrR family transcriptional regulator
MGSTERRERTRLEIRTRILDAARELFAKEGPDNVTMRRIAERIEYTPTTIYHHFKDKNALLEVLLTEDFLVFAGQFAAVLTLADPIERIDAMAREYVHFALSMPNHYRMLFMTPLPSDVAEIADHAKDRGVPERDAYAALSWIMNEAIASGRLKPEHTDLHLLCQMAWSSVHGVAALAIAMRGRSEWFEWRPLADIFEHTNSMIMHTLVRPGDAYFSTPEDSRKRIPEFQPKKDSKS